jgi:hypothetical protein
MSRLGRYTSRLLAECPPQRTTCEHVAQADLIFIAEVLEATEVPRTDAQGSPQMDVKHLTLLIAALVVGAPSTAHLQAPPETLTDPDTYAVLQPLLPLRDHNVTPIVIQREALTHTSKCLPSGKPFENEWRSVMETFKTGLSRPAVFDSRFRFDVPYELVPRETLLNLIGRTWTDFFAKYPKARRYFALSRVAFDEPRSRAMVWISYWCGNLCGGGTFYFRQRQGDGSWARAVMGDLLNCSVDA